MKILGILNVTDDSFSDGGRYRTAPAAIAHAQALARDGADAIDVGAQATNPTAARVPPEEEVARLAAVVPALRQSGLSVSIDTSTPRVMHALIPLGIDYVNDVTALADPAAVDALRDVSCSIILMHAVRRTGDPRAQAAPVETQPSDARPDAIVDRIIAYFRERIAALAAAGIDSRRLILDPGMGLFLGRDPESSFAVLRALPRLRELGRPLCISVSRKSFLGAALESTQRPRPVDQRAAATLAAELWAAHLGAEYIRTHEPRPLRDAWRIWTRLVGPRT